MKKTLLILLMVFSLTACYPRYARKSDGNVNYYTDWLNENGIVDYEREPAPTGSNIVESVYQMYDIDSECNSRNIRVYYGTIEENNQEVIVFMPDKFDEPNVIIDKWIVDLEQLQKEVDLYNETTTSTTITAQDTTYITNDIIIDDTQIRERYVNVLWGGLIINDVRQEIDEEGIQNFVFTNLSHPVVYMIGGMLYTNGESINVYMGIDKYNNYILFSQSRDHNTLTEIYTFSSSTGE